MSSAISTNTVQLKPNATGKSGLKPDPTEKGLKGPGEGPQPWQVFALAALACLATWLTFMSRAQGFTPVILQSVLIGTTALVGLAMLRTLRPLVTSYEDHTPMIGERTRAALEREKMLTLRSLKELEFDRAMGKLSDGDFLEMSGRLRFRATRLIRQLDAGTGHRSRIESDLAKRLGQGASPESGPMARACGACSTANDPDARFCKRCGAKL